MKITEKQKKYIVGGALAVAGFFIARRIIRNASAISQESPMPSASTQEIYNSKVKALQSIIGVTADGIIGPKTKAALSALGLSTTINPSNIDSIIDAATSKAATQDVNTARRALGMKLLSAITTGTPKLMQLKKDTTVYVYNPDVFGNMVKDGSAKWTFNTAQRYAINKMAVRPDGFIYIKTPAIAGGNSWVGIVSPYDITLF